MTTTPPTSDWTPCPAGTLTGMANQFRRVKRIDRLRRFAQAAAVVMILVAASGWLLVSFGPWGETSYGGITCHEVQSVLPDYIVQSLDDRTSLAVETHLSKCRHCRNIWEEQTGQQQTRDPSISADQLTRMAMLDD